MDPATDDGKRRIKETSTRTCLKIISSLETSIPDWFRGAEAIPVLVGTTARMCYSPRSEIDMYLVTPDDKANEVKSALFRLGAERGRHKTTKKWMPLKNILKYELAEDLPAEVIQFKVNIDFYAVSEAKLLHRINHGMISGVRHFQTPQQVIISASRHVGNQRFYELRQKLVHAYRNLAQQQGYRYERLMAGLYCLDILGHLYYGLQRPRKRNLPPLPDSLGLISRYMRDGKLKMRDKSLIEFKSLTYRICNKSNSTNYWNDISKTLYRCACDFLPSINIFLNGNPDTDLDRSTFDIANDGKLFCHDEREVFYRIALLRLAHPAEPLGVRHVWKYARDIAEITMRKIESNGLTDELGVAKTLFLEPSPIDYSP